MCCMGFIHNSGIGCCFGVVAPDTSANTIKKPPLPPLPATRAARLDARITDDVMGGYFVHHILVGLRVWSIIFRTCSDVVG